MDNGCFLPVVVEQPCGLCDSKPSRTRLSGVGDAKAVQLGRQDVKFELQTVDGRWIEFGCADAEFVKAKHHQILIGIPFLAQVDAVIYCRSGTVKLRDQKGREWTFNAKCKARYTCGCSDKVVEKTASFPEDPREIIGKLQEKSDPATRFIQRRFVGTELIAGSQAVLRCNRGNLRGTYWTCRAMAPLRAAALSADMTPPNTLRKHVVNSRSKPFLTSGICVRNTDWPACTATGLPE